MLSAVSYCIYKQKFGFIKLLPFFYIYLGAAGNFLAPISGMSENAFKTVLEIDTVCTPPLSEIRLS